MQSSLPLSGRDILVTREEKAAEGMADKIRQYGGIPHIVPLIAFRPHTDQNEHTYLERLTSYEWIFFTSKNGVIFFFEKLKEKNISIEGSRLKFAAVGKKTCETLESFGVKADFVPKTYTGADFAEEFADVMNNVSSVLISKGNLAKATISAYFKEKNIHCDEWITYETYFPQDSSERLAAFLTARKSVILTFTSPSTVRRFMNIITNNGLLEKVKKLTVACIGPVTMKAAEQYGLTVEVVPEKFTVEDMIDQLSDYVVSIKE
ncbi:uroporphyrinogen-III synthase [Bacillus sp. AK031]